MTLIDGLHANDYIKKKKKSVISTTTWWKKTISSFNTLSMYIYGEKKATISLNAEVLCEGQINKLKSKAVILLHIALWEGQILHVILALIQN